ncbi:exopolysaccharide/PEP-CTERM locus tyrosine autokinase [Methylomagnum ishizawai]|uniref:non-specific protein-tyrosine kinase n=2 Tax=Methylomagnum ishizawai TaxID=1760988 RepID=A0A1Y6CWW2_9GAMM|nr:exopolysaccharide/PEP-CTERM locus tyrosine autokinase [Methylomagnum ishizawai]
MSMIEKAVNKAMELDPFQAPPEPEVQVQPETRRAAVPSETPDIAPLAEPRQVSKSYPVDWVSLKARGMLVPEMATTALAEEYRVIKRPLLMNAFPEEDNGIERANLILVTSSVPGEGKTFTAMNLALSIAMERDKNVLLIDGDVAKPSIAGLFGIPVETGLTDLLKDKSLRFSDVAVKTDIPNFTLLPAGKQDRHSTELLASDAMKKLVRELSERYPDRIVIFDSPPLLAATQGAVLARLVGQIVLVIEADSTPQYVVQESIAKLEGCDVVGCVLNKTKKGFGFNYYGYFYGYGYGYGFYGQHQKD